MVDDINYAIAKVVSSYLNTNGEDSIIWSDSESNSNFKEEFSVTIEETIKFGNIYYKGLKLKCCVYVSKEETIFLISKRSYKIFTSL